MTRQKIIKPIQTIAQQVFKILEEEILSGKYKPGDRLIEREIGDRLGISRIPVREALLSLERWGLVIATGRNRKGREVIGINKREIEEDYSIKELIEASALCEKSMAQDKSFFNGLEKLIEEMKQRVKKQDVENYRELNWQFHHEIAKSLKNQKLYAYEIEGTRYDTGTPLGWLKTNVSVALQREDYGPALKKYLKKLL